VIKKSGRTSQILPAVVFMMLVAGCNRSTSVADILKDPARFSGKDVSIQGTVSNSFSAFGNGIFEVDDSTGQMWVYSQNFGVPSNGTRVTITGRIEQGFSVAGRSYGIILRETEPYR